jgi:ribosomal protein S12 methylthiotransferase accessory factor
LSHTFRLSSSLRAERLETTLSRARSVAQKVGISRVTEITRLDRVGVPVFASIRPDAQSGSLCVNAGKGLTVAEARVGAYMEAIEFAFAEYNRSGIRVRTARAREIYDGSDRPEAILDFCPTMETEIELDAPVACVEASDICSKSKFLVPAELVFLPYPLALDGNTYFGSTSNGLSSGNSILEASIHGLTEVIERDIRSFQSVDDQSLLVQGNSLPPLIANIVTNLSSVGLALYVRTVKNMFGMPFFMAVVAEPESNNPIYINGGYGCHPCSLIALTRAVCEAVQSRLSFIHGGRDELIERYQRFDGWSDQERTAYAGRLLAKVSRSEPAISFAEVEDYTDVAEDLESTLELLLASLAKNGLHHVLRVVYTPKSGPLQVVRILVPGLEYFTETTTRIGPRLRDYVRDHP